MDNESAHISSANIEHDIHTLARLLRFFFLVVFDISNRCHSVVQVENMITPRTGAVFVCNIVCQRRMFARDHI